MGRFIAVLVLCAGSGCAAVNSAWKENELRWNTVYVEQCGSGWMLTEQYVVTVDHVASCAWGQSDGRAMIVFANGLAVRGKPILRSRRQFVDLALIKLDHRVRRRTTLRVGSSTSLAAGAQLVSMGHPGQRWRTRAFQVLAHPEKVPGGLDGVIVLDRPASQGSSGSPIVDANGDVVGILFASTHKTAYAVPVSPYLEEMTREIFGPARAH